MVWNPGSPPRGAREFAYADGTTCACPVKRNNGGSQFFRQQFAEAAADQIGGRAGCELYDERYRFVGVRLRESEAKGHHQRNPCCREKSRECH